MVCATLGKGQNDNLNSAVGLVAKVIGIRLFSNRPKVILSWVLGAEGHGV